MRKVDKLFCVIKIVSLFLFCPFVFAQDQIIISNQDSQTSQQQVEEINKRINNQGKFFDTWIYNLTIKEGEGSNHNGIFENGETIAVTGHFRIRSLCPGLEELRHSSVFLSPVEEAPGGPIWFQESSKLLLEDIDLPKEIYNVSNPLKLKISNNAYFKEARVFDVQIMGSIPNHGFIIETLFSVGIVIKTPVYFVETGGVDIELKGKEGDNIIFIKRIKGNRSIYNHNVKTGEIKLLSPLEGDAAISNNIVVGYSDFSKNDKPQYLCLYDLTSNVTEPIVVTTEKDCLFTNLKFSYPLVLYIKEYKTNCGDNRSLHVYNVLTKKEEFSWCSPDAKLIYADLFTYKNESNYLPRIVFSTTDNKLFYYDINNTSADKIMLVPLSDYTNLKKDVCINEDTIAWIECLYPPKVCTYNLKTQGPVSIIAPKGSLKSNINFLKKYKSKLVFDEFGKVQNANDFNVAYLKVYDTKLKEFDACIGGDAKYFDLIPAIICEDGVFWTSYKEQLCGTEGWIFELIRDKS